MPGVDSMRLKKGSYWGFALVAVATGLPWRRCGWLMPVMSRRLRAGFGLDMMGEKGVVGVSPWLPWRRGDWLMPVVSGNLHGGC